jgi:hypothetical protein
MIYAQNSTKKKYWHEVIKIVVIIEGAETKKPKLAALENQRPNIIG